MFVFVAVDSTPIVFHSIGWRTFTIFAVLNAAFILMVHCFYSETKSYPVVVSNEVSRELCWRLWVLGRWCRVSMRWRRTDEHMGSRRIKVWKRRRTWRRYIIFVFCSGSSYNDIWLERQSNGALCPVTVVF